MTTVYLGLGSNLGDSGANLSQAIQLLSTSIKQIKQAPVYISKAVGYSDQPDFWNTAIGGETDLSPTELLDFTQQIEQQVGRIASFHWGPREIDIDIIFYGDQVIETDKLIIPHSHFATRDFVLQPLLDLNPQLTDPLRGTTVSQLLDQLEPNQRSILNRVDEKP